MDELSDLELKLINGLTEKYPALKSHIPYLKVLERKPTGVGLYVNFIYLNSNLNIDAHLNALYSNGKHIELQI